MTAFRWPTIDSPALLHPQRSAGILEVIQAPQSPHYTLVASFSRPWAWERWRAHWEGVWLPGRTEMVAVIDHHDESFAEKVRVGLQSLPLCGLRVLFTGRKPVAEWGDMGERRNRICGHWHTFLEAAQGRVILGAEDDTLPDWDAYDRLLDHVEFGGALFAQGTCIGRWDAGIVPHWTCGEDTHGPLWWLTGSYTGMDVVPIQGGGWYCFAAQADAMRRVSFDFGQGTPVGPDVWACYQLSKMGRCVGDWLIQAQHFCQTADLSPNRTVIDQVEFRFDRGRWRRTTRAGRGRVIEGREVQVAGSQPQPVESRPVKIIQLFGDGAGTVSMETGNMLADLLAR